MADELASLETHINSQIGSYDDSFVFVFLVHQYEMQDEAFIKLSCHDYSNHCGASVWGQIR